MDQVGYGALAAFNEPDVWDGKRLIMAGDHMHPQEYVKAWSEATGPFPPPLYSSAQILVLMCQRNAGKPARYDPISVEQFLSFAPGMEELGHMYDYFNKYGLFPANWDLESSRKACPALNTFATWVKKERYWG